MKRTELTEAEASLAKGQPLEGFHRLRALVEYPGRLESDEEWRDTLDLFSRIAAQVAGPELAQIAGRAAAKLDDANALYDLGYQLVENKLHGFAATVLSRADTLSPRSEKILTELVCALEYRWNNGEACRRLRASGLVETSWFCRYLLAFHSVLAGDLAEARRLVPLLLPNAGKNLPLARRIEGMLARADAIREVATLDHRDLRGWHLVLNGAILLHLSPYGFDEGMSGRYAYTQDSEARCLEGIRRAALALEAMGLRPPRVLVVGERESEILGQAAAQVLRLPAVAWRPDVEDPGLIVVYDLGRLDGPTLASLSKHRPGQILFAHATCWTEDPPFTADLTTYLYQTNVSPWASRSEPVEDLARGIVAARVEDEALGDVEALRRLSRAASVLVDEGPGATRSGGGRRKQWAGSPVKSSYFW